MRRAGRSIPGAARTKLAAAVGLLVAGLPGWSPASAEEKGPIPVGLLEAVPGDVAAAYFYAGPGEVGSSGDQRSAVRLATFLADQAFELGLLSKVDPSIRAWIDVLVSAAIAGEHPHAVALFDFTATPRADGGHQLAGLRAAVVMAPAGGRADLQRRIQHLLNTYTNRDESQLVPRQIGSESVFELRDKRLPEWATLTWGPVGDLYVIAFGENTYSRMIESVKDASGSLAAGTWFTPAFLQAGGTHASFVSYVHFDALRRGADPLLAGKIARVQEALRLGGVERGLWTFRYAGRALEAHGFLRRNGRDERPVIAGRRIFNQINGSVIPDEARRYAVIDGNPGSLFRGIREAYLAARSPAAGHKVRAFWGRVEAESGVSFERDLFSPLGHAVVIHDYPPHPLRIPLARTVVFRIDGDAGTLRARVDRLFDFISREYLNTGWLRLGHAPDGIWYLQFGLLGPGVAVTDQWVVVSFSPEAVRQNVAMLSPQAAPPNDLSGG